MRRRLGGWAFHQLGTHIQYKAERAGVPVVEVDPRNASRECPECGHTERGNRRTQAAFRCRGVATPATPTAWRRRTSVAGASVNSPEVAESAASLGSRREYCDKRHPNYGLGGEVDLPPALKAGGVFVLAPPAFLPVASQPGRAQPIRSPAARALPRYTENGPSCARRPRQHRWSTEARLQATNNHPSLIRATAWSVRGHPASFDAVARNDARKLS
jgi:hypothetical protein